MPYPKHKLMAIASSPAGQREARDRIGERAADIIHVGQAVMTCEGMIGYFINMDSVG